jgi:hypothetical protein
LTDGLKTIFGFAAHSKPGLALECDSKSPPDCWVVVNDQY